ncbi:MAG TPA: hypothetical protein PK082_00445 [Phycisphaerae bacterium]|nr:hypothetical protein [Phycisphaerae bacterium]
MLTLTLFSNSTRESIVSCRSPAVYVGGARRRDLKVASWEVLPAPRFGAARLVLVPTRSLASLPRPGQRVLVRADGNSGEFRGVVARQEMSVSDTEQEQSVVVASEVAELLSQPLLGLWRSGDDGPAACPLSRLRFNADANGLASAERVEVAGRTTRVFNSAANATAWTVSDALTYLLATAAPKELDVPDPDELDAVCGALDLPAMDLTGVTLAAALARVAGVAGVEIRAAREGLGLTFFRPGRQGRLRRIGLQPAGELLDPSASNLWRGRLGLQRRPAARGVIALGAARRYEVTLPLSPGWDTAAQTTRWRDLVRSESDDWPARAPVFRKWVLNEHGRYSAAPWNLPRNDLSELGVEGFALPVARRLLPCLSADATGQSLGVLVEYRDVSQGDWRRWTNPLWVSPDECAIWLGGDSLPADYFRAAAADELELRVTACLESDARLTAEVPGSPGLPPEVIDLSDRFGWARVHESSAFFGSAVADECDDAELLDVHARRLAEQLPQAVETELTLGWIDESCHVGDLVERVEGRGPEFRSRADALPCVRAVRHDFESQTTTLTVSG